MNQQIEIGLHWAAVALYVISACLYGYGFVFKKKSFIDQGYFVSIGGFLIHTAALAVRWYNTGHGPYLGRYEIYSSLIWTAMLIFVILLWRMTALRPLGTLVMPVSFLLLGMGVLAATEITSLPETFKTFWLFVHVYFAKLAYGSCMIGTALAGIYLMLNRQSSLTKWWKSRLPDMSYIDELSYRLIGFGFIMIGIMIASGAIWANNAWGNYWSWDPVEVWSLISWMVYGIYLHLRRMHGWNGIRAAWYSLAAFAVLVFSLIGLGVFYVTNHSNYMDF